MKLGRMLILSVIAALLLVAPACVTGPSSGFLFSKTKFAGEINPSNEVSASVSAEGCQHQILGLVAIGEAGAGQIARDNDIRRIATVDHSSLNVLIMLYRNYCTIVTGEK
ncbi:MAG TPA: TRL-like family protein [Leptospiraceae bacterium]|nr:TRL-like family protein [Spirochaetaceae bacterium]HBS07029.1 TRL-like family protein [Leptospiraceae bacterium]